MLEGDEARGSVSALGLGQQRSSGVVQAALEFENQSSPLPVPCSWPQMMHGDAHTVSSCSRGASH